MLQAFVFSDGNTANAGAGRIIDLGSGLAANECDTLGVVCDATVTTPSGWSGPAPTDVGNAGMYVFRRTSGASGSVTIKTSADRPCAIAHVRLTGVSSVNEAIGGASSVEEAPGTSTPSLTSPTLADGEASVWFGLLHNFSTDPVFTDWASSLAGLGIPTTLGDLAIQPDGVTTRQVAIGAAVHIRSGSGTVTGAMGHTNTVNDRGTFGLSWLPVSPGSIAVVDYGTEEHEGTAALGLDLALAGAGRKVGSGLAGLGLSLSLAAAGMKIASGTASLGLNLALVAVGQKVGATIVPKPDDGTITKPSTGVVEVPRLVYP